jgi:hypothetical protein
MFQAAATFGKRTVYADRLAHGFRFLARLSLGRDHFLPSIRFSLIERPRLRSTGISRHPAFYQRLLSVYLILDCHLIWQTGSFKRVHYFSVFRSPSLWEWAS